MKKYLFFLALSIISLCLPIATTFASSGDSLRGLQAQNYARTVFLTSASNVTDGDDSTYLETKGSTVDMSYAYQFELPAPTTLQKIRIKVDNLANMTSRVSLYDSNHIAVFNVPLTSVEQTVTFDPVNVKYVYINGVKNTSLKLYTLEVYSELTQAPVAPSSLIASGGDGIINLSWDTALNSTGYNVKRSTTAGGPYVTVGSNVYDTKFTDTTVTNGITYYYVVTALNAGGESANSNEASATPQASVKNRALLVVTLTSGLEKEYDLSITEVNAFIAWYNNRAEGTGQEIYTLNKNYNLAKFISRKDYIAFDKIETFEVSEYTVTP